MMTFHCDYCGQRLLFENVLCLQCEHTLGYLPDVKDLSALEPKGDGEWRALSPAANGRHYRMCENYSKEQVCNWMLPVEDESMLCRACRLNHTIPNLNDPENPKRWARVEAAKRRLVYTLLELKLPLVDKVADPEKGLAFDLLMRPADGPSVMTGHLNGLVTIDVAEADSDVRERVRRNMGERFRTLIGHFRHEVGHYYWDLLIRDTDELPRFRGLFGDERADYAAALKKNYEEGAPADWESHHVSAYASCHPWEDWAETWGNYLHMVDTSETARDAGLVLEQPADRVTKLRRVPELETASSFDRLLTAWFPLTFALNNINRGLGLPDLYPFFLSDAVIAKLKFVHSVIGRVTANGAASLRRQHRLAA